MNVSKFCKPLALPADPPLQYESQESDIGNIYRWLLDLCKKWEAKGREWKNQRMTQLGMGLPVIRPIEVKRWEAVPTVSRETVPTVAESQTVRSSPPSMSPSTPPSGEAEELRKDMRQVVDLMKNMSLNLMNSTSGRG